MSPLQDDGFISWLDAQRYSGLSESTLERLIAEGKLTLYKPRGNRKVLNRRQLREYIESTASKPAA